MKSHECSNVRDLLALRPGDWSTAERGRVETHLAACADCAALAYAYAAQDRLLRAVPPAGLDASQRRQLFSRLERERRSHAVRSRLSWALGVVFAAAVLVAIILVATFARWQGGQFPSTVEASPRAVATSTLSFAPSLTPSQAVSPTPQRGSEATPTGGNRAGSTWLLPSPATRPPVPFASRGE